MTYSFLNHVLRDGMHERFPNNLVLRDERDGALIVRQRTDQARCKCGHFHPAHGTDRRGRPMCHGSVTCACTSFRNEDPK